MTERQHILISDDEEIVVSLVRDCLEDDGYDVETADCGAAAEKLLQSQSFDLLITDIRMPDFDGIELLRRAKALQPNIGAIFMTGYANVGSAKEAIKEGALDYLMKPFEIAEIRSSVKNALQKKAELDEKSTGVELDKMAALTRSIYAIDDLQSMVRMSLEFALIQCEVTCGLAIYWSPSESCLMATLTQDGNMAACNFQRIELDTDPLSDLLQERPELSSDFFVSTRQNHPVDSTRDSRVSKFLDSLWPSDSNQFVTFPLRRSDRLLGLLMLPIAPERIESLNQHFKLVSMTAQHAALSIENLILLEEARNSYSDLQDLQERTIKLETLAARGEVAAEIGHELKNFLGVVYGNISLLELQLQKGDAENYPKYIAAITSNLEKMKRFTSELMRESKLSGEREPISVGDRLRELVEFMRPQKRFIDINVQLSIPEEQVVFETDPLLFQQLLYNVANNAADACRSTEAPRIEITLSVSREMKTFSIAIQDNGSGIDPELLKKAFNTRFTTKEDGHGFGLLVCRRIIDSHQGTLDIESAVGEGTTITITFPTSDKQPADFHTGVTQKITVMDF